MQHPTPSETGAVLDAVFALSRLRETDIRK